MRQIRLVTCGVFGVLMSAATLVSASLIEINNQSFEEPALSNAGDNSPGQGARTFYGWDMVTADLSVYYAIARPRAAGALPVTADDGVGNSVADGLNSLACYTEANDLDVRQTLSTKYEANTKYTLSMYMGQFSVGEYRGYQMGLATATDGTYIAGISDNSTMYSGAAWSTGDDPVAGHWEKVTATFTTGNSGGPIGQNIMIRFGTASLGGYRAGFDGITLDAQSIPEPSTMLLLVIGMIGLLCHAWRKQ